MSIRRRNQMTEFALKNVSREVKLTFEKLDVGEAFLSEPAGVLGIKRGSNWADYFPDSSERSIFMLHSATPIPPNMPVTRVKKLFVAVVTE
jgi:hypothetical protein